jgi:hypothetical protein
LCRFPRCSLPFSRTDDFIGPNSIVSSPGKKTDVNNAHLPDYVHIVADVGDCVVRPCGSVGAAPAGSVWESGSISGDSARPGMAGARKGTAAARTTTGIGEASFRTTAPGLVDLGDLGDLIAGDFLFWHEEQRTVWHMYLYKSKNHIIQPRHWHVHCESSFTVGLRKKHIFPNGSELRGDCRALRSKGIPHQVLFADALRTINSGCGMDSSWIPRRLELEYSSNTLNAKHSYLQEASVS